MRIERFARGLESRGGRLALASVLGLINTLMLRSLPVREPQQLV